MESLQRFNQVRIRQLLREPSTYDAWRVNERSPRVGDIGVLVERLQVKGASERLVVEMTSRYGETIWLAAFTPDEIEPAA